MLKENPIYYTAKFELYGKQQEIKFVDEIAAELYMEEEIPGVLFDIYPGPEATEDNSADK